MTGTTPARLDVTVKVTNDEEEGEVTLSQQQPLIGQELTASVTDSDGGFGANGALTRLTWAWHVADTTDDGDCPAAVIPDGGEDPWVVDPQGDSGHLHTEGG